MKSLIQRFAILSVVIISLSPAALSNDKFEVTEETLIFDTERPGPNGEEQEIDWDDAGDLKEILLENRNVKLLQLNSGGGLIYAAYEMADLIIDFELDTLVQGECTSSCVLLFLAGNTRRMERGSKIGFHQAYWESDSLRDYYETYKDEDGWQDPFDFAEWLYQDTQAELFVDMEYLLERGVSPGFAIQTFKAAGHDMWYPRRAQLLEAGVLTE